jgi:hypothetical protein
LEHARRVARQKREPLRLPSRFRLEEVVVRVPDGPNSIHSSPHQPAIDRDHGSSHIIGQVRRQELDDPRAILDRPEPPQGDQLGSVPVALNVAGMIVAMIRPVAITPGAMRSAVLQNGPR